jgi:hypothetical protein
MVLGLSIHLIEHYVTFTYGDDLKIKCIEQIRTPWMNYNTTSLQDFNNSRTRTPVHKQRFPQLYWVHMVRRATFSASVVALGVWLSKVIITAKLFLTSFTVPSRDSAYDITLAKHLPIVQAGKISYRFLFNSIG